MKRYLLAILVLLLGMHGFSQGINFEHGTWKEVLEKAQQSNKPIFVDVYTSWCGPCKKMSTEIFPLEKVGKIFNQGFICYKIDAEKGEGPELKIRYNVAAFPTFLFVRPDGTLFYSKVGSCDTGSFISLAKNATKEFVNNRSAVLDQEYLAKKNDLRFVYGYLKNRDKAGIALQPYLDEYLKALPAEQRISSKNKQFYESISSTIKATDFAYQCLAESYLTAASKMGKVLTQACLERGIYASHREAVTNKDEKLLQQVVDIRNTIGWQLYAVSASELYMGYYKQVEAYDKYVQYAIPFADSMQLAATDSFFAQKDLEHEKLLTKINKDRLKQEQVLLKSQGTTFTKQAVANALNRIANTIMLNISNTPHLQRALVFAQKAESLAPKDARIKSTQANLLYKMGNTKEAISKAQEALNVVAEADKEAQTAISSDMDKMKNGEKTWKN